jgi:iron complex outermembrane receptor protein
LTIPPAGGLTEGSGRQTEEEDRRYGLGLTSALTWALPRAELTIGTDTRWDHARFENWFTTNRSRDSAQTRVSARQASGGLFVQSILDFTPHLRLALGGRFDGQDTRSTPDGGVARSYTKAVLSPKLGALYHLGVPLDLYANVSRGFRQTDGVIVDPTLPFITEWAYETGVKLDAHAVSGSVAVFRMDVSNEQTFNPATTTSTSGGASRRQGVEIELQGRLGDALALRTDWTFNDARYRQVVAADSTNLAGKRVFNTATYVGTIGLELGLPRERWQVGISANLVGPYSPFDEPGVVRPAYGLVQVSGSATLGAALIEVGVRNVLDQAYRELEAGGFVSPGRPRSVYGGVRYAW